MITVLINAYACSPNMGSEPGMAWNWCVHLAKHCELHIITEGEFRDKIEAALPLLPHGDRMHFYYNPVSEEVRKMCWNQGDWRFYGHYRKWQVKTLEIAKVIVHERHIDILHQLNMIGFREPGYLWKIEDIPFVWGPIDAKEKFPEEFLDGADFKTKQFVRLKNFITKLQLKYSPRVRKAASKAKYLVAASSNSHDSVKKYFAVNAILINETGCVLSPISKSVIEGDSDNKLNLLWVGKIDFRKQLQIAIQSLAFVKNRNVVIHVVGSGETGNYVSLSQKLGVSAQCVWHGSISHSEVQNLMRKSDLLFFTSVAEGTPHVVLEAISNHLPVLCFNTCGQGDSINEKVGIKIPLSNPKQSVVDFAEKLNYLEANRFILKEMSANCVIRQQELSWEKKAEQMVALYQEIITRKSTNPIISGVN